jgi:hypothetical protein
MVAEEKLSGALPKTQTVRLSGQGGRATHGGAWQAVERGMARCMRWTWPASSWWRWHPPRLRKENEASKSEEVRGGGGAAARPLALGGQRARAVGVGAKHGGHTMALPCARSPMADGF